MNARTMINKSALIAVLLSAGLGAAQAEGLYVGGNLGSPDYRNNVNGIEGSGSGVAGKLYGGYQITPNLAVEAGAFDLGHIDEASGKVKSHGVFLDGVASYEVAPHWAVLGRVGVAQGQINTSAGDDSSPALKLGAGLQYAINPNVSLRAEYEHYRFTNAFDTKPDVGQYSMGLKVGF
jgi:OmpA-OmpF porin, OOP family